MKDKTSTNHNHIIATKVELVTNTGDLKATASVELQTNNTIEINDLRLYEPAYKKQIEGGQANV